MKFQLQKEKKNPLLALGPQHAIDSLHSLPFISKLLVNITHPAFYSIGLSD